MLNLLVRGPAMKKLTIGFAAVLLLAAVALAQDDDLALLNFVVIRDYNGQVIRKLGITQIPINRPPFPLPAGVPVPIYFTVQPGGAYIEVGGSRYAPGKGATLIYPNQGRAPAGAKFNFWDYDPAGKGWYKYGTGKVSADRKSIVPDPGVVIYRFTGAMVANPEDLVRGRTGSGVSDPAMAAKAVEALRSATMGGGGGNGGGASGTSSGSSGSSGGGTGGGASSGGASGGTQ